MASRRRIVAIVLTTVGVMAVAATAWWTIGGGSAGRRPAVGAAPRMVDETGSSGLVHTYDGRFDYAVGGGVTVMDCNDDGRPDLFLGGGEQPSGLFKNDSPIGGSLHFTAVDVPETARMGVNGAYPIDIDGDGRVDLVVLRNGLGNVLLRGLGGCRFDDATAAWGLDPGHGHANAFSATWEAGATWPTLAFGNYVDYGNYLGPNPDPAAWCEPNVLVRPAPSGGSFGAALPLTPSWCALSMLFSDWDGSGRADLRVSNDAQYYPRDKGQEQLWRIAAGEQPRLYTAQDGWAPVHLEGMGIASYDLTGDGLPEVYLTSEAASRLQTLAKGASQPAYRDIGLDAGVNVAQPYTGPDIHLPSTAWHPEFADVNNDGNVDLFVSKGNVKGQLDYAMADPSNLLLGQGDGTFVEAGEQAGIVNFGKGRGAALVDFNLDGRLDLVEAFYGSPVRVWRNAGDAGAAGGPALAAHWLALRLTEPGPNVDAIGATMEVRAGNVTDRREVTIGGGHAGGQLGWIHFGLGSAAQAQVRVTWPDGTVGPWLDVGADVFAVADRRIATIGVFEPTP